MSTSANSLSQAANAQLGIPLPLAYGYCRVRGDNILLNQLASKNRVAFYILGQGPWDGIERLWINKKLVNIADTTLVHFHPGLDGTLGAGLSPTSSGGDQLVDSFFSNIPANFQPLTFSRSAYLAVNVPPDPGAPDANLDVEGDYRTSKVRIFDSSGNQTAYQFSTNGAWQVLDLILRTVLNPEWTVAGASAAGGDLTASQKARIDWPSAVSAAQSCDFIIPNGQKRFESSVMFVATMKLQQALSQLLTMNQLYTTEEDGRIFILPDQARGSTFTLTADHVLPGTASFDEVDIRALQNRLFGSFNDLNPTNSATIDTPANNGLVRASNVVTCKTTGTHPYLQFDNVQIVSPDDASFAGVFQVASVPDVTHFTCAQSGANATSGNGYTGTPESRFAQRSTQVDHEKHQNAIGSRGLNLSGIFRKLPLNIDLGNNTMERVMRILGFIKVRRLGLDVTPYKAPWKGKVSAHMQAVDATNKSLIEQLIGDVITVDATVSEQFQGLYEITKKTFNLPALDSSSNSGKDSSIATIDLEMVQYSSSFFSDVATIVNGPPSSPNRGPLPPSPITDNLVRNGDFDLGATNWTKSSQFGGSIPQQFIAGVAGLPRGSSEVIVPATQSNASLESAEFVPVDLSKTYFVECWCKISSPLTGGTACWVGFQEYDNNRNVVVHGGSGAAWCLCNVVSSTTSNGWQYFSAVVAGNGGASPSLTQFNQSAAYIRFLCLLNWGGSGPQLCALLGVRFSEVAAGATRAVSALTAAGQLRGTANNNPTNAQGVITGANPLSQSAHTTTILVAAFRRSSAVGLSPTRVDQ
ncbi:MAG TPA: hypothetical protein VI636_09340 [Candidatus Angelobacter sp.]